MGPGFESPPGHQKTDTRLRVGFLHSFRLREPRPTVMSGGCRCAASRTDIPAARMRMALAPARPGFESPPGHQKETGHPMDALFPFGASLLRKLILRGNLKAGGTRLRFPLQTSPSLRAAEDIASFSSTQCKKGGHAYACPPFLHCVDEKDAISSAARKEGDVCRGNLSRVPPAFKFPRRISLRSKLAPKGNRASIGCPVSFW